MRERASQAAKNIKKTANSLTPKESKQPGSSTSISSRRYSSDSSSSPVSRLTALCMMRAKLMPSQENEKLGPTEPVLKGVLRAVSW